MHEMCLDNLVPSFLELIYSRELPDEFKLCTFPVKIRKDVQVLLMFVFTFQKLQYIKSECFLGITFWCQTLEHVSKILLTKVLISKPPLNKQGMFAPNLECREKNYLVYSYLRENNKEVEKIYIIVRRLRNEKKFV